MRNFRNLIIALPAATALLAAPLLANDKEDHDYDHDDKAAMFIHGAPSHPTDAWTLAAGGRIYDNWAEALDRELPETTHPGYPAAGKQTGAGTWRCKECHGWDYRGADGVYSKGSHYSGIKGISGAIGMDEAAIAAAMRAAPHGYTSDMINDDELARLAAFVSRGQVDMSKYVDLATRAVIPGDIDNGRAVFQTVCAACHGYDGRTLDWGDADEVMNKILNAHPGVEMVNLRAFGETVAGDVLTYIATLPQD